MSIYFLIPKFELTREMLGRSTSKSVDEMPIRIVSLVSYYVVEVLQKNISTDFDGYIQYTGDTVLTATPVSPANRMLLFTPFKGTAAVNTSTVFSYTFLETLILKEVVFKASVANFGDHITLASYASDVLVSSMVKDWYVSADYIRLVLPPKLYIPIGIETRLTYLNVSESDAPKIFMGMICVRP